MDPELRRHAASLFMTGALAEARRVLVRACGDEGTDPQAWTLLARVHRDLGDLAAARDCARRALTLAPELGEALFLAGTIEHRAGDLATAISCYRRASELAPQRTEPGFFLGTALAQQGDAAGAVAQYRRILALDPDHVAAMTNLALALQASGQGGQESLELLKRVRTKRPEDVGIQYNLAAMLTACGRVGEAVDLLEQAVMRAPGFFDGHQLLAEGYIALGRFGDALASLDRALELRPGDEAVVAAKAGILERRSDVDGALGLLAPYLDQEQPCARTVLAFAALSSRLGRQGEAIAKLRSLVEQGVDDALAEIHTLYELGRLYDETGDYDRAFAWYVKANDTTVRTMGKAEGVRESSLDGEIVTALVGRYGRGEWEQLPRSGNASKVPILVVGMPRSGTTLLEQVIASHPDAAGAGELNYFSSVTKQLAERLSSRVAYPECLFEVSGPLLAEIANGYLTKLAEVDRSARCVVDKMPFNYRHLGLIALALPGARVIHTTRDPTDTCLSIYFNKFNRFVSGTNDLVDIAQGYRWQCQLMEYWRQVVDLPILEVSYEALVHDPERETRRVIGFCGLEWSDACLRFHEQRRDVATPSYQQVQRKIYTSAIGRWRNYEKHLAPLRAALDLPEEEG